MKHDLKALAKMVQRFCEERDWDQFHNPKDLAIGIATEACELLDLFRFQTAEDMNGMLTDPPTRTKIGEELADVFFFSCGFPSCTGLIWEKNWNEK